MVGWLLEEKDSPVRYWTLLDLLDYPSGHPEVVSAQKAIPQYPAAAELLKQQKSGGYWGHPEDCYWPKWTATVWALILLAEMGMSRAHPAIEKGGEYYLAFMDAQDRDCGLLPCDQQPKECLWEPCVTGNMAWALNRFGYGNDPRVLESLKWLIDHQLPDGGWNCRTGQWGKEVKHSSFMSSIEPLWAFSEVPPLERSSEMNRSIERGAEFFLAHKLFRSHTTHEIIDESWTKLHFPLFYFYDILHGLRVLIKLGCRDARLEEAVTLLQSKRQPDGAWLLEADFFSRAEGRSLYLEKDEKSGEWGKRDVPDPQPALFLLGDVGKPSKWVTLNALRVLKRLDLWKPSDATPL